MAALLCVCPQGTKELRSELAAGEREAEKVQEYRVRGLSHSFFHCSPGWIFKTTWFLAGNNAHAPFPLLPLSFCLLCLMECYCIENRHIECLCLQESQDPTYEPANPEEETREFAA
jgi:hypothetical protein